MKNSSNQDMKQVFEQLAKIKMVTPNTNLYAKTVNKIHKQNVVSMFWVRAVACLLVVFISTEIYFTLSNSHSKNNRISGLLYKTNNILYNE